MHFELRKALSAALFRVRMQQAFPGKRSLLVQSQAPLGMQGREAGEMGDTLTTDLRPLFDKVMIVTCTRYPLFEYFSYFVPSALRLSTIATGRSSIKYVNY